MMSEDVKNKLDQLFLAKNKNILNVFCTAGYPKLESTSEVILALQACGVDMIEIGMPYSDPIADGAVIQQSNMTALQNGMNMALLFQQLNSVKEQVKIPIILMGYLNPVLQYGIEKFCADASDAGVSGIILPDLPMYEYESLYGEVFKKYGLHFIFLVTPETSKERIRKADKMSSGFLYAVSSSATTGSANNTETGDYFGRLQKIKLNNPVLIGFGISDHKSFMNASSRANGAIIGSAYIKAIEHTVDIQAATTTFIRSIKEGNE